MSLSQYGNEVLDSIESKGFSIQEISIIKELVFHYDSKTPVPEAAERIIKTLKLEKSL